MKTMLTAVLCLGLFGCSGAHGNTPTAGEAQAQAWSDYMEDLDGTMDFLEENLLADARGDLDKVADRAEMAAAGMSKGYGEYEISSIRGFAGYARAAEAWFRTIAIEARQGHGQIAADAFQSGRKHHCGACHEAADQAGQ